MFRRSKGTRSEGCLRIYIHDQVPLILSPLGNERDTKACAKFISHANSAVTSVKKKHRSPLRLSSPPSLLLIRWMQVKERVGQKAALCVSIDYTRHTINVFQPFIVISSSPSQSLLPHQISRETERKNNRSCSGIL